MIKTLKLHRLPHWKILNLWFWSYLSFRTLTTSQERSGINKSILALVSTSVRSVMEEILGLHHVYMSGAGPVWTSWLFMMSQIVLVRTASAHSVHCSKLSCVIVQRWSLLGGVWAGSCWQWSRRTRDWRRRSSGCSSPGGDAMTVEVGEFSQIRDEAHCCRPEGMRSK